MPIVYKKYSNGALRIRKEIPDPFEAPLTNRKVYTTLFIHIQMTNHYDTTILKGYPNH